MGIYTQSDWVRDKNFSAKPGQEIDEETYWEMYDVMPIYSMPRRRDTAGYEGGFMVSEPHSTDEKGEFKYSTFAQKNGRFFFLGYDARINDEIQGNFQFASCAQIRRNPA